MRTIFTIGEKFDLLSTAVQDTPNGKGYTFSGYGASFKKDLAGNVLQKGAFKQTITDRLDSKMIKVRWLHELPMGFVTGAKEDDRGLYISAFVPDTPTNAERIALMNAGVVDKLSIGFDPLPESIKYTNSERLIGKVTLYEVSAVDLPLNEDTSVDSVEALGLANRKIYVFSGARTIIQPKEVKAVNGVQDFPLADIATAWDSAAALPRVKGFLKVTDTATADFDKCFLWVPDGSTKVDDRQFLICDMTGAQGDTGAIGTLSIVPAAIEEAANTVNDGIADQKVLDTLGIPATEVDALKTTIDAYYGNMSDVFGDPGLISPWNTNGNPVDNTNDLSNTLKETFKGATLSSANMVLLKQAQDNIKAVLSNATKEESGKETEEEWSIIDWDSTVKNMNTLLKLPNE